MSKEITGMTFNIGELIQMMTAREVYGQVLAEIGQKNPDIVVLTADVMRSNRTGDFKKVCPDRFFNFGLAEQNMMTAAAGMALMGKMPFVSTFAVFASMRACEQVHTDIAYPNFKVRIVSTHGGLTSGCGTTHNALEDIAIMRSMANMTVIVPGDPNQTRKVILATLEYPGPVYIRLGRGMEPLVYQEDYDYRIGRAITVKDGQDGTIIACGITVFYALEAAVRLAKEGINLRVLDMHTIKPLDTEAVLKAAKETKLIITAEEHSIIGGLGSAVSEAILEAGVSVKFKRLGVPDLYAAIGDPEQLYAKYGIDGEGIYKQAKALF